MLAVRPIALIAMAALLACTGESAPSGSAERGERIAPGGIQVVGTSESITRIADLYETADGTIWVLNTAEPYFVAMTSDGSVRRTWGRRGGGPSEFRAPNVFVHDAADRLWVYDRGHHTLMRVDGPDEPIETVEIPRDSIPSGRIVATESLGASEIARAWIRGTDDGFLFAVGRAGPTSFLRLWNTDLVRLAADGSTRVVWTLADRVGDPATKFGSEAREFLPFPLWTVCPDGSAAIYDPVSNVIRRLSSADAVTDSVVLPPERRLEVTLDRVFSMAYSFIRDQAPGGMRPDSAALYAELESEWSTAAAEIAPVFPEYADLQCSAPNTLWIQVFDPERGSMGLSPTWLRITGEATTRRYEFPVEFRPLRFDGKRVLGAARGEFDIEYVAWVPLPGT